MIDRRTILGGSAALLIASQLEAVVPPPPPRAETVKLTVSSARSTAMTVWRPTTPLRGVALFSHGHGSWPERYETLAGVLSVNGFATVAPMHVDSMHHPDRDRFTREASFGERLADMHAASRWARTSFAVMSLVAAGHSFGTLIALCLAGGLPYLGAYNDPAVAGVLGFSSPGRVPGLVRPDAYAGITKPVMIVTGTADTVPGFVTDPTDHLLPVRTAAGPAFGIVMQGATHEYIAGDIWVLDNPIRAFLAGYVRASAADRQALLHWAPLAGDRFIVRNAA